MRENAWWQKMTNPLRFMTDITDAAESGNNIVLQLPGNTPWKQDMEDGLIDKLCELDRSLDFLEDDPKLDPGELTLRKYCKWDKQTDYRPAVGYAKFLGESNDIPLNETFVWFRDIKKERIQRWIDFVSDYTKARGKNQGGCFILVTEDLSQLQPKRGVKVFSYRDYINEYDAYVFAMLQTTELQEPEPIKHYLGTLIAKVAQSDAELCSELSNVRNYRKFLAEPYAAVKDINEYSYRSNGDRFHINVSEKDLEHIVWTSQISVLFPLTEIYRSRLIRQMEEKIWPLLPYQNPLVPEEPFEEPEDIELGVLYHMAAEKELVFDYTAYNDLKKVRDARNTLAHVKMLDYNTAEWLLRNIE